MKKIFNSFKKFEKNFNKRYSWFFTNGNKEIPQYDIELKSVHIFPPYKIWDDKEVVSLALANAEQIGLSTEVVTWSLKYMKENPSLTIGQTITMGYLEVTK